MELLERLNTIATIKENEEVQGIEVYFDTKPNYDIISELKENKLRWHNVKKCWYVKKSLLNGSTAKKEEKTMELKSLRKITDFNEFMSIYGINHSYHYYGNKPITEDKRKELEEKDNKKSFNRYNIYMLSDGYYLMFDTKPSIDSTLYYDDETPEPSKSLQYFINYNMMNFKYDLSEWENAMEELKTSRCISGKFETTPFININFSNSKEVYTVFYEYCGVSRKDKTTVRDLTQDEISDILAITKDLKEQYIERLTNYFNRYNKNIHTLGYWVNR